MDKSRLDRLNALAEEIKNIERFIKTTEKCWGKLWIAARLGEIVEALTSYGALSNKIEIDKALSDKIIEVMKNHLNELKSEFENEF